MANRFNGSGFGNGGTGTDAAMERMLEKSFSALDEADGRAERGDKEETVKFGPISLPAGIASMLTGFWNEAAHVIVSKVEPKANTYAIKLTEQLGFGKGNVKAAAVTSIAVSTAIKGLLYIDPVVKSFQKHHKARADTARQLAPVLDDIRGKHSLGAFMSIDAATNEVIYAHRQRMALEAHTSHMNAFITLGVNTLPSVATDWPLFQARFQGLAPKAKTENEHSIQNWIERVVRIGSGPLANYITHSNDRALRRKTDGSSALSMILKLEEQVREDPKASSFSMPEGMGRDAALENYIAEIIIQHQKNMASLTSDHTEIRKALREDLEAIAKPLAEAIRNGDISALSLVRLVGEGKIIKKKGRALASPDEVAGMVRQQSGKIQIQPVVKAKDYYAEASFTKDELKQALSSLAGSEKIVFASMFPDSILQEAGMSEQDVKVMRAATLKSYTNSLAEVIAGLAAKSDGELEKEGLAQTEIKKIREASEAIAQGGAEAVKKLSMGPANVQSIEHTLANVAVARVKGDRTYLGKVRNAGQAQLAAMPAPAATAESDSFAEKVGKRRPSEEPQEDMAEEAETAPTRSHAQRAASRATAAEEAAARNA